MSEPLDLRPPDTTIRTRSRSWSLLGFTWWSARVVGYNGLDCTPRRAFLSRDVDRAEAKAVSNLVHSQAKRASRYRSRSHEA